jgi:hypothetical protein
LKANEPEDFDAQEEDVRIEEVVNIGKLVAIYGKDQ